MRLYFLASCAVAAVGLPSVSASVSTQWVEIANNYPFDAVPDYSNAVTADDPILGSTQARTFDLVVTTGGGVRWTSADLQINALPQTLYVKSGSVMKNPASGTWAAQPAAEFSTFICVPAFERLDPPVGEPDTGGDLLGKAQYPVESGMGAAILTPSQIDAAWGDLTNLSNIGSFAVARTTLLDSWGGGISFGGRVGVANNADAPANFSYTTAAIPEPATAGLFALPLLFMRRRMRGV